MEQVLFDFVTWFSWVLLTFVVLKAVFFISLSSKHHVRHKRLHPRMLRDAPLVSILVPSYNEGITLKNCIDSLLKQTYPNFEIVIINDGSTDDTLQVARRLAKAHQPLIRVVNKRNGGKASALNLGVGKARGSIVVCIDADSMFLPNTVEQLVLSFYDADVAAVGGNVKVANNKKLLSRQQSLEYITGLTLQRKAFAHLGCMQVISGAVGAFRRDALLAIGGYATDTIVEDMDVTIKLARHGYKVAYNPQAIAYTEAPESLNAFMKQRYRWTYGSFQVLSKHRDFLWKRHTNYMGFIGMPYFLISPFLDITITLMLIVSLVRVAITNSFMDFVLMAAFMITLQAILISYALVSDKEDKKLIFMAAFDSFVYYHLLNFTAMRAGINYFRGKSHGWNKLQRYGKNIIPDAQASAALAVAKETA